MGATLGVAAGIVELSVGPHIRNWVGDKQDTTRLGLATIVLSLIALAAAAGWRRQRTPTTGMQLLVAAALLVPGLICFTTVGRLWYAPGVLLLAGACAALIDLREGARDVGVTISRYWLAALTSILAAFYVFLGATALGIAGVLGILGGIAVFAALAASTRIPKRLRPLVLLVATLPFAALTWWSVITPLLAILILTIGWAALNRRVSPEARRRERQPSSRPREAESRVLNRSCLGQADSSGTVVPRNPNRSRLRCDRTELD